MQLLALSTWFLGITLLATVQVRAAAAKLEVTFFDVGQADATLVTCPDGKHHMLIDAADTRYPESANNFKAYLKEAFKGGSQHIDIVVASHMHSDHIGSMKWVLENFEVDEFIENGDGRVETTLCSNLESTRRKLVKAGKLTWIKAKDQSFSTIDFCPSLKLEIFEPWAFGKLSGQNDRSVVVRLSYNKKSFLFVGDAEKAAEKIMLNGLTQKQREVLDGDVLKVGHHASDTSSTFEFINAVSPEIAIVSVGKKDVGTNVKYKHPRLSTLRNYSTWFRDHPPTASASTNSILAYDAANKKWRLETRPSGMWFTVYDGTVTIRTDGQQLDPPETSKK